MPFFRQASTAFGPLVLALLVHTVPLSVMAAETAMDFAIPPQALLQALKAFAALTRLPMSYPSESIRGLQSKGVSGSYSTRQALDILLVDTGVRARTTPSGAVTLEVVQDRATSEPVPATLATIHITGYPPLGDGTLYNPAKSASATKTDTLILETPVAVEVVSQQVFKDRQITRVSKALENVSGTFSKPSGINGDFDFFYLRGFYYGDRIYRDGVPIKVGWLNNGQRDAANLERVEVVKGPPSLLYGRTDPGGMVNLVTKQPETRSYNALTQQFGSWDLFRTTLDSTGPLRDDKTVSFRFNFAFEKSNSFRDFQYLDRKFLAPVLRWDVSPQTRITAEAEYLELETLSDPGLPLLNGTNEFDRQHPGTIPAVPVARFYGGPNDRHTVQETLLGINWSHAFNQDWTLQHRFNGVFPHVDNSGVRVLSMTTAQGYAPGLLEGLPPRERDYRQVILIPRRFRQSAQLFYNALNLTGHVQMLGLDHTLLLGADYNRASYDWRNYDFQNLPVSDLQRPIHPLSWGSIAHMDTAHLPESWFGLYLQNQIKLPYGFQLLAGFRYDNAFESSTVSSFSPADCTRHQENARTHDTALTPRFALLWQPVRELSWYGNYSENFGYPNQGFTRTGGALEPELSHQWETGIKSEWLEGRLNANLAAFRIVKQNVVTFDPVCVVAEQICDTNLGKQQSQGLEFDVKGEILPQWRVIGNYTYLDTKVLRDVGLDGGPGTTGQPFAVNPRHMGSVWTTYQWAAGPWTGLTLGAGTLIRGRLQDGVREPGYVLLNLMAAYNFPVSASSMTLQLNVDNLLNKVYYVGSDYWPADEYPGAPRTFTGSVRVEW